MHVEQALERYVRQLRANGRSEHTVLQVQRHVRLLVRWLAAERKASELHGIDEDLLAQFLVSPEATRTPANTAKTPGSMNAMRSSLRTFFAHAARAGWVSTDPARFVQRALCTPPPPRALTDDEVKRLRAVLSKASSFEERRDRMLIEFLLASGTRLSAALALDVEDLDLEQGTALLRREKGSRPRQIFLPAEIRDALGAFLGERHSGPVFGSRDGARISSRHFQRRFRHLRAAAGISARVTPHGLRHTFAGRLYKATGDVLLVREALGHAALSSTLVYARADLGRVRDAFVGLASDRS